MRTLVDLPENELKQLTKLSKAEKVSRAHLVRCAIHDYIEKRKAKKPDTLDESFGMWADRGIDGLEYQLKIRSEWDREF
jgi:metal-responsive CopG/Arc/MetJ family transcriptional regulator